MNDSTQQTPVVKKFWQSSNFWIVLGLAFGTLFIGFPEGAAQSLVGSVFASFASIGILRNFFKSGPKPDWSKTGTLNFWNYLQTIVLTIVPGALPPELFSGLQEVTESLFNKDWNSLLVGLFNVGTILFYAISSNKDKTSGEVASVA